MAFKAPYFWSKYTTTGIKKKQDTVCSNVRTTNLIHKGNTQIEITI